MNIEHIALWTNNLETLKSFYEKYFQATANAKYRNPKTHFESYFLSFPQASSRLEIMQKPNVEYCVCSRKMHRSGFIHIAFSVGSQAKVDEMTNNLEADGFTVVSYPRTTGDGYYESCILDPDGNHIEITV